MPGIIKIGLIGLLLTTSIASFAQKDSLSVLSFNGFLQTVRLNHPLSQKADLQTEKGDAEILMAKGAFDPMINTSWSEKNLDDKLYYRHFMGQLSVPTALGVDVVGGYHNSSGDFVNPENITTNNGLWHMGLEANVLQGLIVNERRIELKKAKVYRESTEIDRQLMLNEIILNSSMAYVEWQQYYQFLNVLDENIQLARAYAENTKLSYTNGEKTALDTLEARIMMQDAMTKYQDAEIMYIKARQNVESLIWDEGEPEELSLTVVPEDLGNKAGLGADQLNNSPDLDGIPLIMSYALKESYLQLDQRLNREKLKPKLKLKYYPLLSTPDSELPTVASLDDYNWGFGFSMPLFLRSERGKIQSGELKIREVNLDTDNKRNEIDLLIENSLRQQDLLREQIVLSEQNLEGYAQLLEGENEKFRLGESSVFLLNKRQEKFIEGNLKLIMLKVKLEKEILKYLYYTNEIQGLL